MVKKVLKLRIENWELGIGNWELGILDFGFWILDFGLNYLGLRSYKLFLPITPSPHHPISLSPSPHLPISPSPCPHPPIPSFHKFFTIWHRNKLKSVTVTQLLSNNYFIGSVGVECENSYYR